MSALPRPEQSVWFVLHHGSATIPAWQWDSAQSAILGIPVRADVNEPIPLIPQGGQITAALYLTFTNSWVLTLNPLFPPLGIEMGGDSPTILAASAYVGEANHVFDPATYRSLPFVADSSTLEAAIREVAALPSWAPDELIARHVRQNPWRPGIADAVVSDEGVPVWALVGAVLRAGEAPAVVAEGYAISPEAMRAALVYYQRHRPVIDARIAANDIFAA